MKVRILSGNQAGAVVEMRQDEAEHALTTGYAEEFKEPEPEPGPRSESAGKKSGHK